MVKARSLFSFRKCDESRREIPAVKARDPTDMQYSHDNLMRMRDGSMAYDAVVRQENYYPSLRAALEKVRSCAPINVTIDFV